MDDAASSPARRSVTSVDLGELKPQVALASAAAGVGPSTWLRELVRRELHAHGAVHSKAPAVPETPAPHPDRTAVYRAWLDADLTAKLDRVTEQGGFRTRAAALRGLLEGVAMSGGSSTGDAVHALGLSNHQLVAIGRNINQIAKSLHAAPGKTGASERIALDAAVSAIHKHLELTAVLVGELRPMLKSKRDKS